MTEDLKTSTHPPLPPTTEEDQFSWLRLLRCRRVGIATFYRLLAEHKTAQEALAALPEVARTAGVNRYEICPESVIESELRSGHRENAHLVFRGSPEYPNALNDLADAPPLLWVKGKQDIILRPMIALVGARNASSLGTRMATALAKELGNSGYTIVSGLARGIDTAAHIAALETGTVAAMAGGVDIIYPAENTTLANSISDQGALLSEQPMGLRPQARHFPGRNRIVSGLATAVVLVEAAGKSGSLITARNALDQGRDVLAVPGHPFDARAAGCNRLIRDGASLVRNASDIIEALAPIAANCKFTASAMPATTRATQQKRTLAETSELHSKILERLGPSPLAEDQLIRDMAAPARDIAPVLVDLELDGKVIRQSGGLLSLAN